MNICAFDDGMAAIVQDRVAQAPRLPIKLDHGQASLLKFPATATSLGVRGGHGSIIVGDGCSGAP
jgi:hypothetical protein